ncbi:MAG: ribonuclease P protein component [Spirochaetes bacterium]|nr:ribonuclease P protein component [Spirochaetota bacterium]MBU0954461.1 ribonuclease P protein component [Spirochaetota bacterium]
MLNDGLRGQSFTFGKHERIRTRQEISRVFEKGQKYSVKGMRLHVMRNDQPVNRAVFVTVRKYGNAVQRNRARRVVSEGWRLYKPQLQAGFDVVCVVYPLEDTFAARQGQLAQLLRRSGLLH